jgi:hypothetical protein
MPNGKFVSMAMGMVLAVWFPGTPRAYAQAGEDDVGELAGLAGAALGGASGTQAAVTGSAGVAFSRHGMIFVDTLFMPLGDRTIQNWPLRATVNRSYLIDFGVDFHIRVPIHRKWAPYGIVGTGLLWNLFRQDALTAFGEPFTRHFNQFNGAFHTGGGLRYYINENWGIRPEVKVIVSNHVYTTIAFGVFWVAPTNWP